MAWLILKYGELKKCLAVRRKFRIKFKVNPRKLPHIKSFKGLVKRFIKTGDVRAQGRTGCRADIGDELVEELPAAILQG